MTKYYYIKIKEWFKDKNMGKFNYFFPDYYPLFNPDVPPEKNEERYYEIDGAELLNETEKAVKFLVPTITMSGRVGKNIEVWFPKSVIIYGTN